MDTDKGPQPAALPVLKEGERPSVLDLWLQLQMNHLRALDCGSASEAEVKPKSGHTPDLVSSSGGIGIRRLRLPKSEAPSDKRGEFH